MTRTYKTNVTSRTFNDTAAILDLNRPEPTANAHAWGVWRNTVEHFARFYGGSNPRFDRTRFLKACGYPL